MADHHTEAPTSVQDYFGDSPDRRYIDLAAQIVAIVNGRGAPARADYAHPRLDDIVAVLKGAATGSRLH